MTGFDPCTSVFVEGSALFTSDFAGWTTLGIAVVSVFPVPAAVAVVPVVVVPVAVVPVAVVAVAVVVGIAVEGVALEGEALVIAAGATLLAGVAFC